MPDALGVIELSMQHDLIRMNAISHNMANVSTVGFKKQTVLATAFTEQLGAATRSNLPEAATSSTPSVYTDHRAGTLKFTGNALDVALEDDGFFAVVGPTGPAYTRQGNWHVDAQGRLVTAAGHPVLGGAGIIQLNTSTPVVKPDGKIMDGDTVAGQLQVVRFADTGKLANLGDGLYSADGSAGLSEPRYIRVRQGYLEMPNVVLMDEMVKMIETVRHFELSQRVVHGYDSMLDRSINILGEF